MPTYNYHCSKCGSSFEKFQKIVDRKHAPCSCGYMGMQTLTAPTIVLDDSFPGQNLKWGRNRKKHNAKLSPNG